MILSTSCLKINEFTPINSCYIYHITRSFAWENIPIFVVIRWLPALEFEKKGTIELPHICITVEQFYLVDSVIFF